MQADRLEDLGAAVALHRGDPHLGHGLDDPLDGGLEEVLHRLFVVDAGEHPLLDHVVDRLKGQVRVDGSDAVAQQHGKVVHLAGLARLQHQGDAGPGGGTDQVVMQAGNGQQGRNGGILLVHPPVGQDQHGRAGLDEPDGGAEQAFQRFFHPFGAVSSLEEQGQGGGLEPRLVEVTQLFKLFIGEDRLLQPDHPGAGGRRLQQVGLRTDPDQGRGDDLLANRIDGGIGDLGEELLEIVVEELGLFGQHRQRRIGSHGSQRLHAVSGHGAENDPLILEGVAEGLLALQHGRLVGLMHPGRIRQIFQQQMIHFHPVAVGFGRGEFLLDLFIGDDPPLLRIHQEHLARLQAPLLQHLLGWDLQNAGLGGHDDQIVSR